jgi:hypothetical protein
MRGLHRYDRVDEREGVGFGNKEYEQAWSLNPFSTRRLQVTLSSSGTTNIKNNSNPQSIAAF